MMNELTPTLLLTIEAVAPFFVLSIVLILVLIRGRKKMRKAAKSLILDVKANEKKDRLALREYLIEKLNFDKKAANTASKKITNERKFLLRNLISGILDKNLDAIANLNQDLNRVCKQYHQLEIVEPVVEDIIEENIDEPVEENKTEAVIDKTADNKLKELKKEIKNLKQEVHITLTTLNNIFKEFSSMFGENVPEGDMSVEQIITAMESFSNKETSNPSQDDSGSNENEDDVVEQALTEAGLESEPSSTSDAQSNTDVSAEEVNSEDVADLESNELEEESISAQLDNIMGDDDSADDLDFGGADDVDDIDGALDMLELDSTDEEGEPDWGDAFAESGDTMEEDKNQ